MSLIALVPVALAAFGLSLRALLRWPMVGIVAIVLLTLVEWEFPGQPPLFSIAGSNVFPLDVLSGLMLIVAIVNRRAFARNVGVARFAWYGLGLVLLIGLARGVVDFGQSTAVNEFRTFLYPMCAMTWGMSLDWTRSMAKRIIGVVSLIEGWGLTLVSVGHIAVYGFGSADDEVLYSEGITHTARALVSGQALALLFCAVAAFALASDGRAWLRRTSGVVFLITIVAVQQRTVWVSAIAVLATIALVGTMRARRRLVGAGLALLVVAAFLLPSALSSVGFKDLADSAQSSGTYDARFNSWTALITQSFTKGPEDLLFGIPSGFGWGRYEGPGRWVVFPPHNWVVTIFLRSGAVGLVFMVAFTVIVAARALRRGGANAPALSIIVASAVYSWSYSWLVETVLFYGWAVASGVRTDPDPGDQARIEPDGSEFAVPFPAKSDEFGAYR